MACVRRWNMANFGKPKPILAIITPNWLKVESAIIFFKSHSVIADIPAINIVKEATINRDGLNHVNVEAKGKKRISKNTPAVTRVEECTRAETGVGAAMAAGSHLENGIWALFVIAASIIHITVRRDMLEFHILIIDHWLEDKVHAIARRIKASPTRLVKAVIIPPPSERGLE